MKTCFAAALVGSVVAVPAARITLKGNGVETVRLVGHEGGTDLFSLKTTDSNSHELTRVTIDEHVRYVH
jgi:hypothetical protein